MYSISRACVLIAVSVDTLTIAFFIVIYVVWEIDNKRNFYYAITVIQMFLLCISPDKHFDTLVFFQVHFRCDQENRASFRKISQNKIYAIWLILLAIEITIYRGPIY